ncbi:hypothetical protein ABH926_001594 [Catenulispora sp. GP43]
MPLRPLRHQDGSASQPISQRGTFNLCRAPGSRQLPLHRSQPLEYQRACPPNHASPHLVEIGHAVPKNAGLTSGTGRRGTERPAGRTRRRQLTKRQPPGSGHSPKAPKPQADRLIRPNLAPHLSVIRIRTDPRRHRPIHPNRKAHAVQLNRQAHTLRRRLASSHIEQRTRKPLRPLTCANVIHPHPVLPKIRVDPPNIHAETDLPETDQQDRTEVSGDVGMSEHPDTIGTGSADPPGHPAPLSEKWGGPAWQPHTWLTRKRPVTCATAEAPPPPPCRTRTINP